MREFSMGLRAVATMSTDGDALIEAATVIDALSSAIRRARALHVKQSRPSIYDCSCGSLVACPTRAALTEGIKNEWTY